MARSSRRRIAFLIMGLLILMGGAGALFFNSWLTRYIESDRFRAEMEKETAKGLHFGSGRYAPIRRTGPLSAASDRFEGLNGRKAMSRMDVHGITARFNPWGIWQRRWQLDDVHVRSGEVGIQIYEPQPEPTPPKPWFSIFLPERVYLQHVESEPVAVTWRFRGEAAGFFATRLLITPHGRDFNYQATGGTLKMALIPELRLRQMRLLITRTELTLYDLDLAAGRKADGNIHAEGKAGTREDKSVDFRFRFDRVPIVSWLPATWKEHVRGFAAGKVRWRGPDTKLEHSSGTGEISVAGARIQHLPFLEKLVALTRKNDLGNLHLTHCSLQCFWDYPKIDCHDLTIEEKGKFCLEGDVTIRREALGGTLQLGVAPEYLDWLPKADEVFARKGRGYWWTTVHLSGTVDQPQQDLSPRVIEAFKESPTAYLGLLLRALGAWLREGRGSAIP